MNLSLIGIYFLGLFTLHNIKKIYIFLILVVSYILIGKIQALYFLGPDIDAELLAPVYLTEPGSNELAKITAKPVLNFKLPGCKDSRECEIGIKGMNNEVLKQNLRFLSQNFSSKDLRGWVLENSILINSGAAYRGLYLHHYSVIMFPVREILSGNLGYSLISQYGLISLAPLLLFNNIPFNYYPILGLLVILLGGLLLIFANRKSTVDSIAIGAILITIALSCDIYASRISPGFSSIRYLPISILLYILIDSQSKHANSTKLIFISIFLALLNSIQFNILFILIGFISFIYIFYINKSNNYLNFIKIISSVFLILLIQLVFYLLYKDPYSSSLFGSVGDGNFTRLYSVTLLAFPILFKILDYFSGPKYFIFPKNLVYSDKEVIAFVGYGLCASYAISFAGSPQHYCGLLLMSFYCIFIMLKSENRIKFIIKILIFMLIPFYFNFFNIKNNVNNIKSDFYSYSNKIGKDFYFKSPINLEKISKLYDDILIEKLDKNKNLFLSKDKIYIEAFKERNLEPKMYDAFLNFDFKNLNNLKSKIKKEGIQYIIFDNENLRKNTNYLLESYKNEISQVEYSKHETLLKNYKLAVDSMEKEKIKCNERYCIYKIQ